jgi:hypothetical protein
MDRTVQLERKLIVLMLKVWVASSTGLIIIPPPIPLIAPIVEAAKLRKKNRSVINRPVAFL